MQICIKREFLTLIAIKTPSSYLHYNFNCVIFFLIVNVNNLSGVHVLLLSLRFYCLMTACAPIFPLLEVPQDGQIVLQPRDHHGKSIGKLHEIFFCQHPRCGFGISDAIFHSHFAHALKKEVDAN